MRVILAEEITRNIKEMCIEANYELSSDVKNKIYENKNELEQSWHKRWQKSGTKLAFTMTKKSDNMVSYRSIQGTEVFLNRIYEVMYQSLVHFLLQLIRLKINSRELPISAD